MSNRITILPNQIIGISLLVLIAFTFFNATEEALSQEIPKTLIIIANPQGTPNDIAFEDLIKVMKGHKPRWEDGTKAKIALMKPKTEIGTLTARKIYGMSPTELSKYWVAMVFEGKSSPPEFFSDEEDLIKYVNKTEGAIGIISHYEAAGKVVTVNGKNSIY